MNENQPQPPPTGGAVTTGGGLDAAYRQMRARLIDELRQVEANLVVTQRRYEKQRAHSLRLREQLGPLAPPLVNPNELNIESPMVGRLAFLVLEHSRGADSGAVIAADMSRALAALATEKGEKAPRPNWVQSTFSRRIDLFERVGKGLYRLTHQAQAVMQATAEEDA